jgi:hypothetical protein
MRSLKAKESPIIVDKKYATSGNTKITYEKESGDEIWERRNGGGWSQRSVSALSGSSATPQIIDSYSVTLVPGEIYEVTLFEYRNGPLTPDPLPGPTFQIFCLWKKPEGVKLITDKNLSFGGTWYWQQVHTTVPTHIVTIGASRKPITIDSDGIPRLHSPDGFLTAPLALGNDHKVEIDGLLPGNAYFYVALVADAYGNWDFVQGDFTTLRRKLTIEFTTLHIYNDGDPWSHGEGEFWFHVFFGHLNLGSVKTIDEFYRPTADIDDWGETDRPYSLGFAHVGSLQVVNPGEEGVNVGSWGIEHDGALESDESAAKPEKALSIPNGKLSETVIAATFKMDCPVITTGDDFHYGVDVRYSVEYAP